MNRKQAVGFLRSLAVEIESGRMAVPGFTRAGTPRLRARKITHLLPAKTIRGALKRAGSLRRAAKLLDVYHTPLLNRCRRLGIKVPSRSVSAKRRWARRSK